MAALIELMEALKEMPQDNLTEGYAEQLRIIEASLAQVEDAESRAAIEELKRDLTELMELTKTTEQEIEENYLEAEERRFKEELALLEQVSNKQKTEHDHMESFAGQLCQAPHKHSWDAIAYHNAIVSSVEKSKRETTGDSEIFVRVFFTNPTHREMLPCNYFLDGNCRFDADNCHFSHGELVNATMLHEYKAPDFERLSEKCMVLAKLEDKLWHRGHVLTTDIDKKKCRVRLHADCKGKREREFDFEELLPMVNDDSETSSSDSENTSEDNFKLEDIADTYSTADILNENVMQINSKQPLGVWEKHTRGIGSKLMVKMGYEPGSCLGTRGKGIIVPISAQILPPGRSLDACMQLREQANGDKDLFSVERKIARDQKKQEKINTRAYERASKRTDVFSFLNASVFNAQEPVSLPKKEQNKNSMQQHTTKSLNVANMRVTDNIRRISRELSQMQDSLKRQCNGTESYKRLQAQISIKNQELQGLKLEERSLSKEQATRKTKEKLLVF